MSFKSQINILFEGYSSVEPDGVMLADCTCTLISNDKCNIIIDTGGPWSQPKLLAALKKTRINPEDINFCISTHAHSDHTGNNNLFLKATHIYGQCIFFNDKYFDHNFKEEPYKITDDISVLATGGHTLSCVSILIGNNNLCGGVVAIAGDLFENEQDINDSSIWINAGSEDQSLQVKHRFDIAERSDIIVPGHGRPFAVTDNVRRKLKRDLDECLQKSGDDEQIR